MEKRLQSGLRLFQRHSRLEAAEDLREAAATVVQAVELAGEFVLHHHRDADLRRGSGLHAIEARAAHTDDGQRIAVEHDLPADHGGVGGEARLPVTVTQDGDRVAALHKIVLRVEDAAQGGAHAQDREVIAGDEFARDQFGPAFVSQAEAVAEAAEHSLEDLVLVAEILVHGIGNRVAAGVASVVRSARREQHQLFRVAHRQQLQDQLIDQREDGGIGADSQGEREHRDGREQGRFAQGAERVAQVLNEISHADDTAAAEKGYATTNCR